MSRRSSFRNFDPGQQLGGGRIDTRPPSPEKAAGMRNMHYDTDGTPIGAIDRYGNPLGSRKRRTLEERSELGNPTTPGLDALHKMNAPKQPGINLGETTEAAPSGSQLLKDRQALHADMKKAGRGGITREMEDRAMNLGVSTKSLLRVENELPQASSMIAAAPAVAKAVTGVPPMIARPADNSGAPTGAATRPMHSMTKNEVVSNQFQPTPAAAPLTGRQLAEANIAKMGVEGAYADLKKREAAALATKSQAIKTAQGQSKWRTATAMPAPGIGAPTLQKPATSLEQMAGLRAPSAEKTAARRFAMPQPANIQAVGTPPPATTPAPAPAAAPVSEFQSLTTPRPAAIVAPKSPTIAPTAAPVPSPAAPVLRDKNPVTFTQAPRTDFRNQAKELAAQSIAANEARKKRQAELNANVKIPSWQEGTVLGGANKAVQRFANQWRQ